jgi:hypothetical protein
MTSWSSDQEQWTGSWLGTSIGAGEMAMVLRAHDQALGRGSGPSC